MATQLQMRRGTASQNSSFTGAEGEVSVNTTNDSLHIHDGSTAGGFELARVDGSNWANITTTANIDVGTVTADGLTVDGASAGTVTAATFTNTTSAGGTRVQAVLQNVGSACNVNLISERVGANFGADFIVETSDTVDGTDRQRLRVAETGDISFYEDTGTTPKLFWDASAESLGIGTSSQTAALHVINSSASGESIAVLEAASTKNGYVYINGDDNRRKSLIFQSGGVNKFSMGVGDSDELSASSFFIGSGKHGGSGADLVIDSSGNLLVGTTSAVSNVGGLSVDATGSFHCASFQAGGNGYGIVLRNSGGTTVGSIVMNASSTSYNTSSDQRLKENIADADDAGSKVDAIQVRKFDWIADGSHQDYGMIAQELQTVAPEAVHQPEDPDEMMGVDYSKLVPMLVKEIQSLRARVAQLEN